MFSRIWESFESGKLLTACAWCERVQIDHAWFPLSPAARAAIDERHAFTHAICAQCAEAYMPQLAKERRGNGQRAADGRAPAGVPDGAALVGQQGRATGGVMRSAPVRAA